MTQRGRLGRERMLHGPEARQNSAKLIEGSETACPTTANREFVMLVGHAFSLPQLPPRGCQAGWQFARMRWHHLTMGNEAPNAGH
jgi:hypothetical protein